MSQIVVENSKTVHGASRPVLFSARNAALEGPLFHGIIGGIARRDGECWRVRAAKERRRSMR